MLPELKTRDFFRCQILVLKHDSKWIFAPQLIWSSNRGLLFENEVLNILNNFFLVNIYQYYCVVTIFFILSLFQELQNGENLLDIDKGQYPTKYAIKLAQKLWTDEELKNGIIEPKNTQSKKDLLDQDRVKLIKS